jgi:hypothetical protein
MRPAFQKLSISCSLGPNRCCLAFLLLACVAAHAQGKEASGSDAGQQNAISFERLMQFLRRDGRDRISDAMAAKVIEKFGLAFRPTPDELRRIRTEAGALPLLFAIEHARVPALPPVILNGALSISCAPVDCDVWVDGRRLGRTDGGVLPWVVLPPGKIDITVASPKYETKQNRSEVVLASGERRNVDFVFQPTQAYLTEIGARFLREMLVALGPTEPGNDSVRAGGALYLRDESGVVVPWSIVAWVRGGQLVRLQASRLSQRVDFVQEGGSWKEASGIEATSQLTGAVSLLASSFLPRQVGLLAAAGTGVLACDLDRPVRRFRTSGPAGTYTVTLDSSSRPGEIEREMNADAPRATFLYSDYSERAGAVWPGMIQVIPAGSGGGIEARFTTVERVARPPEEVGRPPRRPRFRAR